jgi:hypothetical protein
MANMRMLTLVTNLVEARRLPYIPPNGKVMQTGETVIIPGAIETELFLGALKTIHDEYIHDLSNNRITVTTEGFGGSGSPTYFTTTLGDGINPTFIVDVGFPTAGARIYLFDTFGGGPIYFFEAQTETPGSTQITFTFTPAPGAGQVSVFVFPAS